MFIARSAARIRFARAVFLLLGLAPATGLVAWAVHRRSDAHRLAVEERWEEALGIPLAVAAVEHPRPGVIRGRRCILPAVADRPAIELPLVEIESSDDEDRIRIGHLDFDAATAATFAALARQWLADEVRFRRTCIIEVADFSWGTAIPPSAAKGLEPAATPLRIECVARPGTRALRIVRQAGQSEDEVRIVRGAASAAADASLARDGRGEADPASSPASISLTADCRQSVPLAAVVLAAGGGLDAAVACGEATVSGELDAAWDAGGWRGTARGRIDRVELASAAAAIGGTARGRATIDVTRLAWEHGRVSDALVECAVGAGAVDGRLFDRIVLALAARPGPAARPLPPGGERSFDAAACIVGVGPHGVQVMPSNRLPIGLAVYGGELLLAPPAAAVPGDRIAWMLSAPGTAYAPALGPGSWLMSVLPEPGAPPEGAGRQF
jgi:hypothetical protein